MPVKVKICGMKHAADAIAAADAGADLIGLNFWPGTPRCVSIDQACEIADAVRERVEIVALFVDAPRHDVMTVAEAVGTRTVQLHGSETAEFAGSLDGLRVIKAFRIGSEDDIEQLAGFPAYACLLDARVEGMVGGTGRTINWELARTAAVGNRVLLAGGLTPGNVGEAVRQVEPWGVDTASGVEKSPGEKDSEKVRLFVERARSAEQAASDG